MQAIAEVAKLPKITCPIPKEMAIDAPNAAPEDIPNIEGDAMGFLKRLCMVNPEMANAAPTSAADMILGRRTSRIMNTTPALPLPNIASKISLSVA